MNKSVVQNIFDNGLGVIREKAQKQEFIKKSFNEIPENLRNEVDGFEKMKKITKVIVDKVINEENNRYVCNGCGCKT